MQKSLKTIGAVHTHTHTHTQARLKNKEKSMQNALFNIAIYKTDQLII